MNGDFLYVKVSSPGRHNKNNRGFTSFFEKGQPLWGEQIQGSLREGLGEGSKKDFESRLLRLCIFFFGPFCKVDIQVSRLLCKTLLSDKVFS